MEGENVFTTELKGASGMIVIGSEGKGFLQRQNAICPTELLFLLLPTAGQSP